MFIEDFKENRRSKYLREKKVIDVEKAVHRDYAGTKNFLRFLKEKKGMKKLEDTFFDVDQINVLEEYIENLKAQNSALSTTKHYCKCLGNLLKYCVDKFEKSGRELRKAHARKMETRAREWGNACQQKERGERKRRQKEKLDETEEEIEEEEKPAKVKKARKAKREIVFDGEIVERKGAELVMTLERKMF